jgi:hypothetical protein
VQVRRIAGVAAARDGDRETGQTGLQLAHHRRGGALGRRGIRGRREDHQLALEPAAGLLVGSLPAAIPARFGQRRQRGALDPARAALGHGQHARPPVALLGVLRSRPDDDHAGPSGDVAAELAGAGDDVLAVRDAPGEQVAQEVADGRLGGALGCLGAVDLEADQVRDQTQQRGRRRLAAGAVAQLTHRQLGHAQLDSLGAPLTGHRRALVLGRGARHGQHAAGCVDHDHAGVEGATGRAGDLGQAGAGLDGLGYLVERLQEGPGLGGRRARGTGLSRGSGHQAAITRTGRRTTRRPARSPRRCPAACPG